MAKSLRGQVRLVTPGTGGSSGGDYCMADQGDAGGAETTINFLGLTQIKLARALESPAGMMHDNSIEIQSNGLYEISSQLSASDGSNSPFQRFFELAIFANAVGLNPNLFDAIGYAQWSNTADGFGSDFHGSVPTFLIELTAGDLITMWAECGAPTEIATYAQYAGAATFLYVRKRA